MMIFLRLLLPDLLLKVFLQALHLTWLRSFGPREPPQMVKDTFEASVLWHIGQGFPG